MKASVIFYLFFVVVALLCCFVNDDNLGYLIMKIAVLEEQKRAEENEAAENAENDAKPTNTDPSAAEPVPRNDGFDGKPDINDVPMEDNQVNTAYHFLDYSCSVLVGVPE